MNDVDNTHQGLINGEALDTYLHHRDHRHVVVTPRMVTLTVSSYLRQEK